MAVTDDRQRVSGHGVAIVLAAAVWGSVAIAVGIDAARRGRSGGLWGLTTFLLGPIGLGLYVLVVLSAAASRDAG